jgi:hypothetical protein
LAGETCVTLEHLAFVHGRTSKKWLEALEEDKRTPAKHHYRFHACHASLMAFSTLSATQADQYPFCSSSGLSTAIGIFPSIVSTFVLALLMFMQLWRTAEQGRSRA